MEFSPWKMLAHDFFSRFYPLVSENDRIRKRSELESESSDTTQIKRVKHCPRWSLFILWIFIGIGIFQSCARITEEGK